MDTLSKILSINSAAVIPTSFPNSALSLANVVKPTGSTCKGMNDVARVASEMMMDFERLSRAVESDG